MTNDMDASRSTARLVDILAARTRLRPFLTPSPLRHSTWLSQKTGASVWMQLECVQLTNSFKIRGALNALLALRERGGVATVVTASAGNHGRAIAWAGERLGIRTIVFTPATAPEAKRAAIRLHGADLRDEAVDYDAAERQAREYARRTSSLFVSPYSDASVIAGAGTIALELIERLPEVQTVVVPLGGGGLASGVGLALKCVAPHVRVVGVEVAASRPFAESRAAGRIVRVDVGPSLADGLVGNLDPDTITFPIVQRVVHSLVSVDEPALRQAMHDLAAHEHVIVEGAGAVTTAAVMTESVLAPDERAALLVTGSNVDLKVLRSVIA